MKFSLQTFDILDSTNIEALKQSKLGADEGVCIVARQQTAGRGRYGRTWVSERDAGLYFSVILRPRLNADCLPLITLMAGVAVHDTLTDFAISPDIKWVNDILVNEKKIAGILAETTETDDGLAVIVGIGINLTPANIPPDLITAATCLADVSPTDISREELLRGLTEHLGNGCRLLKSKESPSKIIADWKRRSSYSSGKLVRVVLTNETITGVTDGLEANGALRIRRSDGNIAVIHAGDVEQVRAAV